MSVQWVYPFAGAIDTQLPAPPRSVHMMLKHKADWVEPQVGSLPKEALVAGSFVAGAVLTGNRGVLVRSMARLPCGPALGLQAGAHPATPPLVSFPPPLPLLPCRLAQRTNSLRSTQSW